MAKIVEQTKEFSFESIEFYEEIENEVAGETKVGSLARLVVTESDAVIDMARGPPVSSPSSKPEHNSDEQEAKA